MRHQFLLTPPRLAARQDGLPGGSRDFDAASGRAFLA
jgi:hypothetical protein